MRSLSSSSTLLALAALGLTALAARPAVAGTLFVPQQFSTIQKALNAAKPYDTVLVSAKSKGGVYNEAITISTPHVVLQGRNNPVIDGTGLGVTTTDQYGDVFTMYPNGIDIRASHVAVRGMTVQNTGDAQSYGVSGINAGYVTPDDLSNVGFSDLEVSGCTVVKNTVGISIFGYASASSGNGSPIALNGYLLLGDTVSGNFSGGAQIVSGSGIVVSGCQFTGNAGGGLALGSYGSIAPATQNAQVVGSVFSGNTDDGLDAVGSGLTFSADKFASNTGFGLTASVPVYNPAAPAASGSPNPAASAVLFSSFHDNGGGGLETSGTQTISGNSLTHNAGVGLYLNNPDYSQVTFNTISATTVVGGGYGAGAGLFAEGSFSFSSAPGPVMISANSITSNAGDGVFFDSLQNSTLSHNDVSGNSGIGIHLSDTATLDFSFGFGGGPNTVTQNRALHNTVFDARDDASASDTLTYNGYTYNGDSGQYGPTVNVWTKNLFGTTDPAGLSK